MVALRTSDMFAGLRVLRPTVVNAAVQTASAFCDKRQLHSNLSFR
jgi:hypothetical protein